MSATFPAPPIKRMSPAEFREGGYLAEINRRFLHPLGLALEVVTYESGVQRFGEVWDYQDDPEGLCFCEEDFEEVKVLSRRVLREEGKRHNARVAALGFWIQDPFTEEVSDG